MRTPLLILCGAIMVASSGACSSAGSGPDEEHVGTQSARIFNGVDGSTHVAVGSVNLPDGSCSGTLVAPNLAVTSLHCIAKTTANEGYLSDCTSESIGALGELWDPGSVAVIINGQKTVATQIISSKQTSLCAGDIAFLVLATPITGVPLQQFRLDSLPAQNEPVTGCGVGATDTICTLSAPNVKCSDGTIMFPNGGYFEADQDTIPKGATLSTNNACLGDSGSALTVTATGALLGTFSILYNADISKVGTTLEPCKYCDGDVSMYFLFSAQKDLVVKAFGAVGRAPWREGHSQPADIGATCTDSLDCNSQLCVGVGAENVCSQICNTSACPTGTTCTAVDARSVCLPNVRPKPASCASAPPPERRNRTHELLGLLTTAAALLVARRRRVKLTSRRENRR